MIAKCRHAMSRCRRVLLQAPTGAGKTALAAYMIQSTSARGQLAYFICHREELLDGTSRTLSKYGIPHSFIASGRKYDPRMRVQVCSIDTLKNRTHLVPEPKLAIWDECHHIAAAGWLAVLNGWQRAYHIGLSATPWRADGAGLDALFDEMVLGPTVAWLIEHGHLARYTAFIPKGGMDVSGVGKRMGDFISKDIEEKVDRPKLVGDIITHWRRHASNALSIAFAPSLDFSMYMAGEFNAAGIPSAHLDGNTHKTERRQIIQAYADGRIRVLWNRFLFGEGFDLSAIAQRDITIDCVIDAAPTMALNMAKQRWGRGMRGDHMTLLDHAGNILRHGFPDDETDWTDLWKSREKGGEGGDTEGPPPPIICEGCFNAIRRPAPACCPHCGKPLRREVKPMVVDDTRELVAANDNDKAAIRAQRKQEEADCKTMDDWVRLARKRDYKNPMSWAFKKYHNAPRRKYGKLSA